FTGNGGRHPSIMGPLLNERWMRPIHSDNVVINQSIVPPINYLATLFCFQTLKNIFCRFLIYQVSAGHSPIRSIIQIFSFFYFTKGRKFERGVFKRNDEAGFQVIGFCGYPLYFFYKITQEERVVFENECIFIFISYYFFITKYMIQRTRKNPL